MQFADANCWQNVYKDTNQNSSDGADELIELIMNLSNKRQGEKLDQSARERAKVATEAMQVRMKCYLCACAACVCVCVCVNDDE